MFSDSSWVKTLTERVDRRGDLLFGEARGDVLLAVPVEGLKPQPEDPLELRFVGAVGDQLGESWVRIKRQLSRRAHRS